MKKIELIIFDVNQTMFSLKKIEKEFEKLGLNHLFCEIWFNSVLKEGFALNKINKFISFKDIGISILTSILLKNKIKNPEKISKRIFQNFNKLTPVDGLEKSLNMLNILDVKMTTLTNGNKHTTLKLLSNNNLNRFIVKTFSYEPHLFLACLSWSSLVSKPYAFPSGPTAFAISSKRCPPPQPMSNTC